MRGFGVQVGTSESRGMLKAASACCGVVVVAMEMEGACVLSVVRVL